MPPMTQTALQAALDMNNQIVALSQENRELRAQVENWRNLDALAKQVIDDQKAEIKRLDALLATGLAMAMMMKDEIGD